ncbi:FtsW/RodA/SpoVE family cell cycle protein [Tannerella forsythia]|uniref:Probable peptidoglycan glycosyltransferase FtsW n=1 Tax=Tannerella forsythia TaxID=28112 RepID=A0A3P1ZAT2_TANFO|nr:FtsW/RodA/SpoVE family cell cycle protein [Tannerella forsythia]RRD79396.1 FtsW/RodA/SpoVE family cell cycle protein [Tannerella forsythia]
MAQTNLTKKVFQGDTSVWIIFLLLCCFSLVEVFSATSTLAYKTSNIWIPIVRHASFLLAGFLMILGMVRIHYKYFSLAILLMPLSILMLAVTPIIGVSANDASRWLEIFGVQFQPSEFGKLACIVYVAFLLSKRGKFSEKAIFQWIVAGVGIVCFLILLYNFSTAFLLGMVCLLLMFIGQISLVRIGKLLLYLLLGGVVLIAVATIAPKTVERFLPRLETWSNRLIKHADDREEAEKAQTDKTYVITDENYQVTHAKIAIARGGLFGKMPGRSVQRDFLPQAYSDFIFAIIIEELGVVGGIFVLLLYIMLLIRVGIIARRCEKLFPKYLVIGCGLLIVMQALTNMAVAVNLIPVTGQPLPLISRGGTSTMLTCIYIGIILSVSHFGAGMGPEEEEEEESEEKTDMEEYVESSGENPIFAVETIEQTGGQREHEQI